MLKTHCALEQLVTLKLSPKSQENLGPSPAHSLDLEQLWVNWQYRPHNTNCPGTFTWRNMAVKFIVEKCSCLPLQSHRIREILQIRDLVKSSHSLKCMRSWWSSGKTTVQRTRAWFLFLTKSIVLNTLGGMGALIWLLNMVPSLVAGVGHSLTGPLGHFKSSAYPAQHPAFSSSQPLVCCPDVPSAETLQWIQVWRSVVKTEM